MLRVIVSKPPKSDGCHDATRLGLTTGTSHYETESNSAGHKEDHESYLTDPEEPSRVWGHLDVPADDSHCYTALSMLSSITVTEASSVSPCDHVAAGGTFEAAR